MTLAFGEVLSISIGTTLRGGLKGTALSLCTANHKE